MAALSLNTIQTPELGWCSLGVNFVGLLAPA